jgi:hypothetical protein
MNNGKYHTETYKALQEEKNNRRFGPVLDHKKICECCGNEFIWQGRRFTKSFERAKFCSRSCSNNRQMWWNENATHYRTIALQNWAHECAICGFNKVVAIHHVDEDHFNNDPKNLIPLCPNHHEMVHSKWKYEVQPEINRLVEEKWAVGIVGNTVALQASVTGSNPVRSTNIEC